MEMHPHDLATSTHSYSLSLSLLNKVPGGGGEYGHLKENWIFSPWNDRKSKDVSWWLLIHIICLHKQKISLMKSHWICRCKSYPESFKLAILSAPQRVIWPRSAGNVSSLNFFKLCVQLMSYWRDALRSCVKKWNGHCHKMKLQFWHCLII